MGTHPIFESDFDCLTEWIIFSHSFDHSNPCHHQEHRHRTNDAMAMSIKRAKLRKCLRVHRHSSAVRKRWTLPEVPKREKFETIRTRPFISLSNLIRSTQ